MSEIGKRLRAFTPARVGLGRTGSALPTKRWLELQHAHASAREAVHAPWVTEPLVESEHAWLLSSQAADRETFLKRPDLGRALDEKSASFLASRNEKKDVVFCVSDGLSATAIDRHFLPFWRTFLPEFETMGLTRSPLVLVPFGRVAVADTIGAALGARLSVIFVGERPGLSAADSLGVYLTFAPRPGLPDSRRNCLSNIRPPDGLSYVAASRKLCFLIGESLRRGVSGISLKEESDLLSPAES